MDIRFRTLLAKPTTTTNPVLTHWWQLLAYWTPGPWAAIFPSHHPYPFAILQIVVLLVALVFAALELCLHISKGFCGFFFFKHQHPKPPP